MSVPELLSGLGVIVVVIFGVAWWLDRRDGRARDERLRQINASLLRDWQREERIAQVASFQQPAHKGGAWREKKDAS